MRMRKWIALLAALCLLATAAPAAFAEEAPELELAEEPALEMADEPALELVEEPVPEESFELDGFERQIESFVLEEEGSLALALETEEELGEETDGEADGETDEHPAGWAEEEDGWVYYTEEGERATGWIKVLGRWYYLDEDGVMLTGWQTVDDVQYYLMDSGAMAAERWLFLDDHWYYFNIAGRMLTGWRYIGERWYYLEESGAMATGWVDSGDDRYYMSSSGIMSEGWRLIDDSWYYFRPGSGKMATGWRFVNDKWYFLSPETGAMVTGWLEWKDHTYYLKPGSGEMAVGELMIDGNLYAFADSGALKTASAPFEITFMDIGRNDGILIYCGGEYAYIDSGMYQQGVRAVEYMRSVGVGHLKYYIGTHSHKDHVGGAPYIIANIQVDEIIAPHEQLIRAIGNFAKTSAERAVISATPHRIVTLGQSFSLGGATFTCLGPVHLKGHSDTEENNNSLILRLTYGSNSFLLTGDATGEELKDVEANNPGCMRSDVFKNPHHYARQEYAATLCAPIITVFSTASSHMPSGSYVSFLKDLGSAVYITATNHDGNVKITSDGTTLTVYTRQ